MVIYFRLNYSDLNKSVPVIIVPVIIQTWLPILIIKRPILSIIVFSGRYGTQPFNVISKYWSTSFMIKCVRSLVWNLITCRWCVNIKQCMTEYVFTFHCLHNHKIVSFSQFLVYDFTFFYHINHAVCKRETNFWFLNSLFHVIDENYQKTTRS